MHVTRRSFLAVCSLAMAVSGIPASAAGTQPEIEERYMPQLVPFEGFAPGTVVVDSSSHYLFLVLGLGKARRYGIGVGRAGLAFKGEAAIGRKAEWPSWRPTNNMIRRNPGKYARYADGVPGGPGNPLGARALYLYRNGKDTLYRIHGTNEPSSIGRSVSNGCIRMLNDHVIDLFARVPTGTRVVVR